MAKKTHHIQQYDIKGSWKKQQKKIVIESLIAASEIAHATNKHQTISKSKVENDYKIS